jgi:hypothetical protein
VLIPQLATRPTLWALGRTFTGSALMPADADLITGGLLTNLKNIGEEAVAERAGPPPGDRLCSARLR